MDTTTTNHPQLPPFHLHHRPQDQSLPPLSALTNEVNRRGSVSASHHSHPSSIIDTRDSGNWSQSQSKHSSTISNCPGVPIQSILNSDTPPSNGHLPPLSRNYPSITDDDSYRSHRSSIDSRVNYNMGHLALNPPSPTTSAHMTHPNGSRASLASSLAHQRGIVNDGYVPQPPPSLFPRLDPASPNRILPRQAPVIHPNPRSVSGMPDPTAAAPTKGYAWAFPDRQSPSERRRSSSGDSSGEPGGIPSSTHGHSPPGLRGKEHASGTYSRTPELRVSHKMAERKRRSEMKQLFEELHSILPNGPNTKSSKWEILAKAIDHIKNLRYSDSHIHTVHDQLRHESNRVQQLESENRQLRQELKMAHQHLGVDGRTSSYTSLATTIGHDSGRQHPMASSHSLPPPPASHPSHPGHHQPPGRWGRPISSTGSAHSVPPPPPPPQSPGAMTGIDYGGPPMPSYSGR